MPCLHILGGRHRKIIRIPALAHSACSHCGYGPVVVPSAGAQAATSFKGVGWRQTAVTAT